MSRLLLPEEEWFRPPRHLELCSTGDFRNFLWICEPARGDIYGVSYRISASLKFIYKDEDILTLIKEAAKAELYRRIELEERRPEGSQMEVFMWVPVIIRREDGSTAIGNF